MFTKLVITTLAVLSLIPTSTLAHSAQGYCEQGNCGFFEGMMPMMGGSWLWGWGILGWLIGLGILIIIILLIIRLFKSLKK